MLTLVFNVLSSEATKVVFISELIAPSSRPAIVVALTFLSMCPVCNAISHKTITYNEKHLRNLHISNFVDLDLLDLVVVFEFCEVCAGALPGYGKDSGLMKQMI